VPKRPATAATPKQAAEAEEALDVEALVAETLERVEVVDF